MPKFYDQLEQAAFESLASDPAAPTGGAARFYFNTVSKTLKMYDGTQWIEAGSGGGSGEINYVTNPSAKSAITGWTASAAGITVARTATLAEVPRETLSPYGIKITPVSGTTDYVYYRFQNGDADKGKKMKIQWAQKALAGYAAGDLVLEMWTNSASNYAGSYSQLTVQTPSIPLGDFVMLTTFSSTTADYYELRVRRAAGTTAIVLGDVVVGPGTLASVPSVTDWVASPGWATNETSATLTVKHKTVGDMVYVRARFNYTGTTSLGGLALALTPPTTLRLDESKINDPSGVQINFLGQYIFNNATHSLLGNIGYYPADTNFLGFIEADVVAGYTGAAGYLTGVNPIAMVSGDKIEFYFYYPAIGLASQIFSSQTSVEYAFNTDTSDVTSTTGFGYGVGGSQFGSFTGYRAKRVRFLSPIMATDVIQLQVQVGGASAPWTNIGEEINIAGFQDHGGSSQYGMGVSQVSATDIDVVFGTYASFASTYTGAGAAWSGIANNPIYNWRVVKSSNPLSIGHNTLTQGNSGLVERAGQLLGTNTNDSAAAGHVGEIDEQTWAAATVTAAHTVVATHVLTPGAWLIQAYNTANISAGTLFQSELLIGTAAGNNTTGTVQGQTRMIQSMIVTTASNFGSLSVARYVSIGVTTTFYTKYFMDSNGAGAFSNEGISRAIRIR